MWRKKKFIIGMILAVVVLAGSIGGVALAQAEDEDTTPPEPHCGALLEKVCDIYNANPDRPGDIDCDLLTAAFAQAREELRPECPAPGTLPEGGKIDREAMEEHLQTLYDEGKITQEQYENMKARLEAMPDDMPMFGFRGHIGFRGFGGPCGPCPPEE
jgi:hypothetical protein